MQPNNSPFSQEDPVLCTERADELQISLCAKISEHIKNVPVPSVLDTCTPLLELLSCVCISGPWAALTHTNFCISDPRVRVGVLLCGRKWGTHSHITPPLHGERALQGAIRELYHIYLASVVRCHHSGTNKKVKTLPIKLSHVIECEIHPDSRDIKM